MNKRVLFFFPHNPYPPADGSHQRCLSMVDGLSSLGYEVSFLSSTLFSQSWSLKKTECFQNRLREAEGHLRVFRANLLEHLLVKSFRAYWKLTYKIFFKYLYAPPFLKNWFRQNVENVDPSVIFMNYAYWDPLIEHNHSTFKNRIKVIETHDLLSLNRKLFYALRGLARIDSTKSCIPDTFLADDFLNTIQLNADPKEFEIYDSYTHCISISKTEDTLIRQNTKKTKVAYIPMTFKPVYTNNTYLGPPVYTMGPNVYNYHGYLYFSNRVVPNIVREIGSFAMDITGSGPFHKKCKRETWSHFLGFVPSLSSLFENAGFAICPVIIGTGQQVKIVEAMAHGLAVVCHSAAAKASNVHHGVNGLVAQDAEEFAEYTKMLYQDRGLCMRMGKAARETVEAEASSSRLTEWLSKILPY